MLQGRSIVDEEQDGPSPSDGNMTQCNIFIPLNTTNLFNVLITPYLGETLSLATFTFPLTNSSSLPFSMTNTYSLMGDFALTATGLGSSGTLEMVGSESPSDVQGGTEGFVQVDVVVRYSGDQELDGIMRVCSMVRGDGGVGIGIYVGFYVEHIWG